MPLSLDGDTSNGRKKRLNATAREVAEWMVIAPDAEGELAQEDACEQIYNLFGKRFIYENSEGGESIDKAILKEFRKLTSDDVVWSRGDLLWRKREESDGPGRQQD